MAKWFRFDKVWDDKPAPRVMAAYSAGSTVFIPDDVVERAAAAGAGSVVERPDGAKTDKAGRTTTDVEFKG